MESINRPTPEEVNFRSISNDAGCIHCKYCDWSENKMTIRDDGVIESECMYLKIKIDENHLCDLIC